MVKTTDSELIPVKEKFILPAGVMVLKESMPPAVSPIEQINL